MSIEGFRAADQVLRFKGDQVVAENRGVLTWLARTWVVRKVSKAMTGRDDYDIVEIAKKLKQDNSPVCQKVHQELSDEAGRKWKRNPEKLNAFLAKIQCLGPAKISVMWYVFEDQRRLLKQLKSSSEIKQFSCDGKEYQIQRTGQGEPFEEGGDKIVLKVTPLDQDDTSSLLIYFDFKEKSAEIIPTNIPASKTLDIMRRATAS